MATWRSPLRARGNGVHWNLTCSQSSLDLLTRSGSTSFKKSRHRLMMGISFIIPSPSRYFKKLTISLILLVGIDRILFRKKWSILKILLKTVSLFLEMRECRSWVVQDSPGFVSVREEKGGGSYLTSVWTKTSKSIDLVIARNEVTKQSPHKLNRLLRRSSLQWPGFRGFRSDTI